MFLCTYCLEHKPDSERSEEHVIPAALGGSWTVIDVCETCQEWANREIDRPFNQKLVGPRATSPPPYSGPVRQRS